MAVADPRPKEPPCPTLRSISGLQRLPVPPRSASPTAWSRVTFVRSPAPPASGLMLRSGLRRETGAALRPGDHYARLMLQATRIAIRLVVIGAAMALCVCGSALAGSPRGTLTSSEYRQLSDATAALNRSASARAINWARAQAACRSMGTSSALLRSQRVSCVDSIDALEALAEFPSEQARCAAAAIHKSTATTGTTTTAAGSGVIRMIICLNPHYESLERYAGAIYRSDIAARKQALQRGFIGTCLATLASTPADLRKERLFAADATKLADDVKLLIRVTDGKAAPSELNQNQIDNDVSRFESSARSVLNEHGPQKLSACPHQ